MVQIYNKDLFRVVSTPKNDKENSHTFDHYFTEPKDIELKFYSRVPFTSFINENNKNRENNKAVTLLKNTEGGFVDIYGNNVKSNICTAPLPIVYQHVYEDIIEGDNIVLAAIPIKGIVYPITYSPNFDLYNAMLLITPTQFQVPNNEIFDSTNKILYLSFLLRSTLTFSEYIGNRSSEYGTCINHILGYVPKENGKLEISDTVTVNTIKYEENEHLFKSDPAKRIFYLREPDTI